MSTGSPSRQPGTVVLAAAPLVAEDSLVSLCRRARAAGEEFGLDPQAALGLSAATYELARGLRELGVSGDMELGVGAGPSLQVLVTVRGSDSMTASLRDLVTRLRPMVCELATTTTDLGWSVRLVAPLTGRLPAVSTTDDGQRSVAPAVPHLQPAIDHERALQDVYAELQETNRGVVALYAELEARAERLREAEERLRLLLDGVRDYAICMLTPDGNVASWSTGAERLFGVSADRVVGHNFNCFFPLKDREAGVPEQRLRQAAAEDRSECEGPMVRNGGDAVDAHALITPVRNGSGGLRGFAVVVHDLTERRRLEDDLRRRADDLAAANRAKEDFLATLSHELRTPLNAMLGWTRLVRTGKLNPAGVERALETIERNARLQAQLIADILDVSRIVTGKLRLQLVPLELAPVVAAAVDSLKPGADAKGVRIDAALDNSGTVLGDPDRLQQVVWNLLSNAIKFTPAGGHVRVLLEPTRTSISLIVTDTGEGIDPALLPFVFDRFRQGDASVTRPHGGLGLGLSIVRHIVEMHGGKVQGASDGRGHGSTFSVQLPNSDVRRTLEA